MKRIIYSLVFLAIAVPAASPQQPKVSVPVTNDEFQQVLVAVSNEDWDTAFRLATKQLNQLKEGDVRLLRLRYIYMYAAAGKVSEGRMEFDELTQRVKDLEGKDVALPYRPIMIECRGAMNFICPTKDSKLSALVCATNKTGTTILAFEYIQLKEAFDFANHENEAASIVGKIKAIVPNPNKSRGIVMRLYISDAVIELKAKVPAKQTSAFEFQRLLKRRRFCSLVLVTTGRSGSNAPGFPARRRWDSEIRFQNREGKSL